MKDLQDIRIAIVGATGLVGQTLLQILSERNIPASHITLYASERSAGQPIEYPYGRLTVENEANLNSGHDVIFGFCSSSVTRALRSHWEATGVPVIDNSSAYRLDPDVPLIVPEVNPDAITKQSTWIANPNCSTIQLVRALKPMKALGLEAITVATYQSVSGAGRGGLAELERQRAGSTEHTVFVEPIELNVVPWIMKMDDDGETFEEYKMRHETRKILDLPVLSVVATCVRVPVKVGHGEAVFATLNQPVTREQLLDLWRSEKGIVVRDETRGERLPTPLECAGSDDVFVGRVRVNPDDPRSISFWNVADNVRVGAASNAFGILCEYYRQ